VFFFDVISVRDVLITIGIHFSMDFFGNIENIFTIPFTWTCWTGERILTVDVFGFWTVFMSPIIFDHDHTFEEFFSANGTIIVGITFGHKEVHMFILDIITKIDCAITIGI
jgi:hypothetical protein